jgi:hypothetical protein
VSISGKVTASTVAASVTSILGGIVGPHVFPHGVPSDVKGLALGVTTAAITFVSGYLAKHRVDVEAAVTDVVDLGADLGVPYSQLPQSVQDAAEEIGIPLPVDAPSTDTPSVPVAE